MFPLPAQYPSAPESNSSSLLHPSAKGSTSYFKSFFSTLTSSEKQKLSSSTYQSLAKSLEMEKPHTNDEICNMIMHRLSELRSGVSSRRSLSPCYRDDRRGADWNNGATLHTASTSYRDAQSLCTDRVSVGGVKSCRGNSGLTSKPKDEGDPHLTEHRDSKNEQGGSEVFTPSSQVTENLEIREGVPHAVRIMVQKKRGDANLNPVYVTGFDRKSTKDEQRLHTAADVMLVPSVLGDGSGSAVANQTGQKCSEKSQIVENVTVNVALCENEHTFIGSMAEEKPPVTIIRDPQYDDISDEDQPGVMMTDEDKETDKSLCSGNEPSIKKYSHEPVQVQIKPVSDEQISVKAAQTSGELSCSYPRADDGFHLKPHSDAGWQTNHSSSPCIMLEGEHEMHSPPDDNDEDDDDGWEVIPVSILNLEFDPGKQSDLKGEAETGVMVQKAVPASAFSQMEIFDTPVEVQAVKSRQVSFVSVCGSNKRMSHSRNKRNDLSSEVEDSNDTEDSCDYSSGPEGNYITVSRQLLKNLPASSRRQEADVINLDSDDETDCRKRRRKRFCSSPASENSGAAEKTRHFPQTVEENCQNTKLPGLPGRFQEDPMHMANVSLSERTEQHGVSRKMNLNDNIIITILSDSDE